MAAGGRSVGQLAATSRRTLLEASAGRRGGRRATQRRPARAFHRLEDVRLRGLLHLLRDDARLQTFVEREIGPLLAYDAQHGTTWSRSCGLPRAGRNKSAAADAAHLSRPAFYERLHRIERVLGVDLDEVESCLSLHVALLALDALRH